MAKAFGDMLKSDSIKKMPNNKAPKNHVYRGMLSIENIIEQYKEYSRDEIYKMIKARRHDNNLCSESCEAINMDLLDGDRSFEEDYND